MNDGHTCEGKVKAALTCAACLSRVAADSPPPSAFKRVRDVHGGSFAGNLKPYTDDPSRDLDGLKKGNP